MGYWSIKKRHVHVSLSNNYIHTQDMVGVSGVVLLKKSSILFPSGL